ncbi:hypothetical protein G7062_11210 [Erysipelothrix sp. HDW6C]|uniref:hypothetical protein n=1 Tax=Erysipelothrix sp. HDW6C TaxID=2714930 RepID=UPI00140E62CF|nr:hypothetical protein [Erysipelothrix sp. HDW6C]QIK70827.1 hypothetical protein G7062_11210 [Erysipelothrix sp. HDW6C]
MKRTKKEFKPYNDYHDRPFGLKWGTAFAMDELVKTINAGKEDSQRVAIELPQMSRTQIDTVLQEAFLKSKTISIQLKFRDNVDRLYKDRVGKFEGFADEECLYLGDEAIDWADIRHVRIVE